ncbi:hypothetical protein ABZ864_11380 [Streptomyces sp. NPDC047082]|uniref:hypothetical protein n=1 Tax=Streptomyces sp. NPDC047082 TaxID=3155259 RepID=UPI00340EA555
MHEPPHRVVLLAQYRTTGWARLCQPTSVAHAHGDGPPVLPGTTYAGTPGRG